MDSLEFRYFDSGLGLEVLQTPQTLLTGLLPTLRSNERVVSIQEEGVLFVVAIVTYHPFCISPDQSVADAYQVFNHELIHKVGRKFHDESPSFLSRYKDQRKYVVKQLLAPGGEVEAWTAGVRARIRAGAGISDRDRNLSPYFYPDGDLRDREGLLKALLLEKDYVPRLEKSYFQDLVQAYLNIQRRITVLGEALRLRKSSRETPAVHQAIESIQAQRESYQQILSDIVERAHVENLPIETVFR